MPPPDRHLRASQVARYLDAHPTMPAIHDTAEDVDPGRAYTLHMIAARARLYQPGGTGTTTTEEEEEEEEEEEGEENGGEYGNNDDDDNDDGDNDDDGEHEQRWPASWEREKTFMAWMRKDYRRWVLEWMAEVATKEGEWDDMMPGGGRGRDNQDEGGEHRRGSGSESAAGESGKSTPSVGGGDEGEGGGESDGGGTGNGVGVDEPRYLYGVTMANLVEQAAFVLVFGAAVIWTMLS